MSSEGKRCQLNDEGLTRGEPWWTVWVFMAAIVVGLALIVWIGVS